MPKVTNDDIKKKLDYIGLDLEKIPDFFTNVNEIDYRPLKAYEDNGYRVYKYVPISKIKILLTPMNRLNTIKEKYGKASSLKSYLQPETEEDIIKHTTFLKMLKNVEIEEIEKLIKEQDRLNKEIPFKVKFSENYIWQIYYSDIDDTYFMLVTTEDLDYAGFFYLLKKQIEYHKTKKEQMIFVPIAYENYSNEFLKNSEIADIEKYLWFFTKNWSNIYDVYDKKDELSLHIVGEVNCFDNIKCVYKNKLNNKEEALKFYKFLKAIFILNTELPHHYNFQIKLDRYGSLEFRNVSKKITYENMFSLLSDDYLKARDEINQLVSESSKLQEKIEKLKLLSSKREAEYLLKEKQIATYLECKKTFFGRLKYFFKTKKKKKVDTENQLINIENETENEIKEKEVSIFKLKEFYTVEDIVKIYKELDKIINTVKNLKLDEKALENKIKSIETKIKNANLYIEEIDKHEKSIFEFWRFANKDENRMLNQGVSTENINKKKIEKVYNYLEDKEEIGELIDKLQRKLFTKTETDSIYIATTKCLNDLNNLENEEMLEESLAKLKEELQNQRILFENDKIDIFGGATDDNTKVKMLGNKKHRENIKDKQKILDINKNTNIEEYKNILLEILNNIKCALEKTKDLIGIPVYASLDSSEELKGLQTFSLNAEEVINKCEADEINLYQINLKEDIKAVYFSNIIYYDNYNKTLPIGMHVSNSCLIDLNMYTLKQINKNEFRISKEKDEFKIQTKKVVLKEFELEIK